MTAESAADWGQFGLAGLVIFALFIALFTIVKWLINHIDKQQETHKHERAEWRDSVVRQNEKLENALNGLSNCLRELPKQNQ